MKQDWTEQLRQRMAGYEEPAPEGLWEAIEQSLEQQTPLASRDEKDEKEKTAPVARRVPLRRWLAVAASALVLLTAGVALLFQRTEDKAGKMKLGTTAESSYAVEYEENVRTVAGTEGATHGSVEGQTPVGNTAKQPTQLVAKGKKPAVAREETNLEPTAPKSQLADEPADTYPQVELAANKQDEKPADSRQDVSVVAQQGEGASVNAVSSERSVLDSNLENVRPQSGRNPLMVSLRGVNLLASNGSNAVSTSKPIFLARSRMNTAMYENNSKAFEEDPIRLIDYADDTDHQHPFTVGLTVGIPLTERLWMETGLTYTRTKSTFTTRMGRNTSVYHQRLQYVGVPFGAGYTFWRSRSFAFYAVAGLQADLNVDAHLETDGLERHLDKDRLLLSVGGRAGAEYRFLPHFSVYLEPGLRYYFDNGSRLQTVFKEKPLQLDFQLGVRYSLK